MPLQIVYKNITDMQCDAIVNPTNRGLIGYSGIDEAVHRIAGEDLDRECEKIAPVELGFAKITAGYNLKCKYIIHTVGPHWYGGLHGEAALLKSCYEESLKLAIKNGCESVAFPLISSGNRKYPKDLVMHYAVEVIRNFLYEHETDITVYLCIYDKTSYEFSKALFDDISKFISYSLGNPVTLVDEEEPIESVVHEIDETDESEETDGHKFFPQMALPHSLSDFLKSKDKPFMEALYDVMDAKGIDDVTCYKKANVSKKTFNKLKNNHTIKPSKQTALAFAIALELTYEETQGLLATAGLTLSNSNEFDLIVHYFILKKNYDIFEINEALFEFDQPLLGSR